MWIALPCESSEWKANYFLSQDLLKDITPKAKLIGEVLLAIRAICISSLEVPWSFKLGIEIANSRQRG